MDRALIYGAALRQQAAAARRKRRKQAAVAASEVHATKPTEPRTALATLRDSTL